MRPITRNLLIINVIVYMLQLVCDGRGIDLTAVFGLHFYLADDFAIWQPLTYMFLHGSFSHLFFNMFSLWMFGSIIEQTMTARRYLTYYLVCGVGAALCQWLWQTGEYFYLGLGALPTGVPINFVGYGMATLGEFLSLPMWTTIGASGACFGILLAFGMTFPEHRIMLIIPPIPMKAKYFVWGYGLIELFSAFASNGNVAHFAHLGGMFFGWLLIRHWRKAWQQQNNPFRGWQHYTGPRQRVTLMQRIRQWTEGLFRSRRYHEGGDGYAAYEDVTEEKPEPPRDPNPDHRYNAQKSERERRIDEILDKIRRSGYAGLTQEEKEYLFNNSKR